jgi:hypothetical protein
MGVKDMLLEDKMDILAIAELLKVLPETLTNVLNANSAVKEITDIAAIQAVDKAVIEASQLIITDAAGNMKDVDIHQPVPQGSYSMWAYRSEIDNTYFYGKYLSWDGKTVQFWLGLYASTKKTYLILWFFDEPCFADKLKQAGFEQEHDRDGWWYTLPSTEIGKKLQDLFDKLLASGKKILDEVAEEALKELLKDALLEILKKLIEILKDLL